MAVDPNQILAITQPKLEIRRISHLNVDEINEVNPEAGNNSSVQTTAGFLVPYVEVDNYIIPNGKLLSLSINQSGFLPELTMSFMDVAKSFGVPVETIPMPNNLKDSYQKYTCADMSKFNATVAERSNARDCKS